MVTVSRFPGRHAQVDPRAGCLRILRDGSELAELPRPFGDLVSYLPSPMQEIDWLSACAGEVTKPDSLKLVVLDEEGRITALAPLVERGRGVGRLELLGMAMLHEPMDLLYRDGQSLARLVRGLVNLGQPLFLARVWAYSPVIPVLQQAYAGRGVVLVRPCAPSPWIPLDETWQAPERHLKARRRADLRRARRQAERFGRVEYELHAPTPAEVDALLQEAFAVEAAGWKGRLGTALALDRPVGAVFTTYARAAARAGRLRLCFLRLNGQAAATQIAVESERRFWLLKIGYDERFARCSPGTLLMLATIDDAARRGLRSYEFLGSVEPWVSVWSPRSRPCVSIRAYPLSLPGMTVLTRDLVLLTHRKVMGLLGGRNGQAVASPR